MKFLTLLLALLFLTSCGLDSYKYEVKYIKLAQNNKIHIYSNCVVKFNIEYSTDLNLVIYKDKNEFIYNNINEKNFTLEYMLDYEE
jgi:uncharacterized protein YueI